ncbi:MULTISPECIES: microviridin/marinostatin family tricyclic proteinase inhibitor [unclassified Nostoc]|uniref:microviridin/marinostatin family tricyclic proteinase inhibitor n=1 Tax=unclassified Nostoc TaxID=2593658 RepID=UPI0025AB1071|nr:MULTISPECIES: microviridin/marinostatin family tricyclic proteinase inhibitor [unclassified Nostoc]MDM9586331.1 microviridin/marinostatin family tricyclic proteinase inhibitor [Nostoc sp. GT001]MDZ7943816.1 microviridin/marinostatin family tricyclic proteinase inhibitor [Nostoc sp. EfeVER01]MDZ7990752.1 microviridin/marinostatin family tricyclic proteinase inhibitor [Nostoc sp. EspVER01]
MSENKPEKLNSQAVPFFARFLEGQSLEDLSDEDSKAIIGGKCNNATNKNKDELVTTLKFPSDQEDGAVTKKYPSDSDEFAVTQKFPSDGDDSSPSSPS